MVIKTLDIRIQIERAGKNMMIARSSGITVDVREYCAREERYINVRYEDYLQYNAMRIARRITNDMEMVYISDYYPIREVIESMLKMLHEQSVVRACLTNMTVHILGDNDNEENN